MKADIEHPKTHEAKLREESEKVSSRKLAPKTKKTEDNLPPKPSTPGDSKPPIAPKATNKSEEDKKPPLSKPIVDDKKPPLATRTPATKQDKVAELEEKKPVEKTDINVLTSTTTERKSSLKDKQLTAEKTEEKTALLKPKVFKYKINCIRHGD